MSTPSRGLGPGDAPESVDPRAPKTDFDVDVLVLRARAGDLRAQGELVGLYRPRLRGFLRLRVRPAHEIDDVLQVIWTKMAVRIRDLRDHQLFETWLFTLARNACFDRLRRIRVRPGDASGEPLPPDLHSEENPRRTTEIREGLDVALRRFGIRDKRLVEQLIEGESYEAMAAREGLGLSALKVRIHRLRRSLRAAALEADSPGSPLKGPRPRLHTGPKRHGVSAPGEHGISSNPEDSPRRD
ncbi:MAG: hypothetical protein RIR76_3248 [Verrucomicrobiota bacterium]